MSVGHPVISRQARRNQWPSFDPPFDNPWPVRHHAEADDRDLGRVDYSGYHLDAAIAKARDRNRWRPKFRAAQPAAARPSDEIAHRDHQ